MIQYSAIFTSIGGSVLGNGFWIPGPRSINVVHDLDLKYFQNKNLICIISGLGQENFWSERCGQDRKGAKHCGQDRLRGRALRPHDQLYPRDECTKLIGRGGGPKIVLQEITHQTLFQTKQISFHIVGRGKGGRPPLVAPL